MGRVRFSDSGVDVRGFTHSGISPLLMLSCHRPTHHPTHPLISPLLLHRGGERGLKARDALEVKRSMWSGLPGRDRSVGRATSGRVDVFVAGDTVTKESAAALGQINLLTGYLIRGLLSCNWLTAVTSKLPQLRSPGPRAGFTFPPPASWQ